VIYPSAVLREGVTLGDRVTVHAGAVIGADGFGFVFVGGEHRKIPQVGAVEIGDDVEIGACSCVDRATTGKTVVGAGTKIDNLVQVAHNVKVGRGVLLVAQAGIAGSTTLGDFAVVGGQVGIADHLSIAPGTRIASQAGVIGDIGPGDFVGSPTMAPRDYFRSWSVFTKLPELKKRVAELEKRLARFETKEEKGDA
jgi:UDP-3-O-[3-hydroxymyristoyl] glucosamine N-acyltransferase